MTEWFIAALTLIGVGFSVLAAVGIYRMPDLYMRMQASSKSATLGVSCLILASALRADSLGAITQALLVVAFLFLTVPVAAHVIGQAAYANGVEMWSESVLDELRIHTENQENVFSSSASTAPPSEEEPRS